MNPQLARKYQQCTCTKLTLVHFLGQLAVSDTKLTEFYESVMDDAKKTARKANIVNLMVSCSTFPFLSPSSTLLPSPPSLFLICPFRASLFSTPLSTVHLSPGKDRGRESQGGRSPPGEECLPQDDSLPGGQSETGSLSRPLGTGRLARCQGVDGPPTPFPPGVVSSGDSGPVQARSCLCGASLPEVG